MVRADRATPRRQRGAGEIRRWEMEREKGAHAVVNDVDSKPASAELIEEPLDHERKISSTCLGTCLRWHLHVAETGKVADSDSL